MREDVDRLPAAVVKKCAFDVFIEAPVPVEFWEPGPFAEQFLERLYWKLQERGWPRQTIDSVWSFFEESVEFPATPSGHMPELPEGLRKRWGEGKREELERIASESYIGFYIWIPGEWIADNPAFFEDLKRLMKEEVITDWRIYCDRGPLQGEVWSHGGEGNLYFVVGRRRRKSS